MELRLLIQNSIQQDYLPEYPRYLPSYQSVPSFDVALLHPPCVDCPPFPYTFMENLGDGGKSYPTTKSLLTSPTRKIPCDRFINIFRYQKYYSFSIKQQF